MQNLFYFFIFTWEFLVDSKIDPLPPKRASTGLESNQKNMDSVSQNQLQTTSDRGDICKLSLTLESFEVESLGAGRGGGGVRRLGMGLEKTWTRNIQY